MPLNRSSFPCFSLLPSPMFSSPPSALPPLLHLSPQLVFSECLLWSRYPLIVGMSSDESAFRVHSWSFTHIWIHLLKQIFPLDCFVPCRPHSRLPYLFSMTCRKKGPNFLACLPRSSRIWLSLVFPAESLLLYSAYPVLQVNRSTCFKASLRQGCLSESVG